MNIKIVAEKLDVPSKELQEFDVQDIFNNNNRIQGFLCRRSDHRYGALVIYSVNGKYTYPQIIYATPKLHYPFGKNTYGERIYNFPQFVKVKVYQKHDGTNILNYSYEDVDGKRYSTFKTRLTPIMQESFFGDFVGMWKEMLEKYPQIRAPEQVMSGKYTLSYELYGYRNPHLIEYKESLETKLLFGVKQENADVVLPQHFTGLEGVILKIELECDSSRDLVEFYNEARDHVFKTNKKKDDGVIVGSEGYIFYVLTDEYKWKQFKAKSEDIEAIHWSAAEGLPLDIILPTTWNALESCDELTVDYVLELLREEYDESLINRAYGKVEKAVQIVKTRIAWRNEVLKAYNSIEFNFKQHGTKEVMRALSRYFDRSEMGSVFTVLKELNEV